MHAAGRALAGATSRLTPIAIAAALLALVLPSRALANGSDLLLAGLVLFTALGIPAAALRGLRRHVAVIGFLSIAPLIALGALAWAIGRPFAGPVQHGLLGAGLASSEVASVGLVALAGADATVAVAVVTGSLICSAVLGPLAIGVLGGGHAGGGKLLARFALVVIAPLVAGVAVRTRVPRLGRLDAQRDGVCALVVATLVYAALSGASGGHGLAAATLAAALFLAVSALLATVWLRFARRPAAEAAVPGAFAIGMRDFAVAAALATQAFGTAAGTLAGVYGVLMLIAGSLAATRLRRGSSSSPPAAPAPSPPTRRSGPRDPPARD